MQGRCRARSDAGDGAGRNVARDRRWSRRDRILPEPLGAADRRRIARTNREIKALTPALLAPVVTAGSDSDAVRVSAHVLNGALYVIVVNTTETTVQAKISVDGIAGRALTVLGEGAVIAADSAGFSDTFSPLAARVYIAPPQGW